MRATCLFLSAQFCHAAQLPRNAARPLQPWLPGRLAVLSFTSTLQFIECFTFRIANELPNRLKKQIQDGGYYAHFRVKKTEA